jgi:hypothetical protein
VITPSVSLQWQTSEQRTQLQSQASAAEVRTPDFFLFGLRTHSLYPFCVSQEACKAVERKLNEQLGAIARLNAEHGQQTATLTAKLQAAEVC